MLPHRYAHLEYNSTKKLRVSSHYETDYCVASTVGPDGINHGGVESAPNARTSVRLCRP